MRPSRDLYFLTIAKAASLRSTCTKRQVGAVLVNQKYNILATGYNGVVRGSIDCNGKPCPREGSLSGENLNLCLAVHAEANALLQCPDTLDIQTAYVTASPCFHCVKLLLNTSCCRIVFLEHYPHNESKDLWEKMGRIWMHYPVSSRNNLFLNSISRIEDETVLPLYTGEPEEQL